MPSTTRGKRSGSRDVVKGFFVLLILFHAVGAQAVCRSGIPLNPVTDLCWQCIFPVSIAGIEIEVGQSIPVFRVAFEQGQQEIGHHFIFFALVRVIAQVLLVAFKPPGKR